MKTEIKRQYKEQISDMFQTLADFSDTPLKQWWIDGWSDVDAMIDNKCYTSYFRLTGFEEIEVNTTVSEIVYADGRRRWFPRHDQIDLHSMILELLVERFKNLQS